MKPAFVLLFILVATLLLSSCNTDEQEQTSAFELDPKSMTTEFSSYDGHDAIYKRVITDSSYYIEDSTGVLAERMESGAWIIENYAAALEAVYKIDSAFAVMYNKDSTK